ncbi:MAG: Minf_1886 family protein [Puniceicoccaceae bacterium]
MAQRTYSEVIEAILDHDSRYEKGAYYFVRGALDFTLKSLKKEGMAGDSKHVSGQQLLEGIREFALEQFGPLAYTVFQYWGLRESRDFGNIVFNLIEVGVLGKNDRDDIADFAEGFDFKQALLEPFEPEGKTLSFSRN